MSNEVNLFAVTFINAKGNYKSLVMPLPYSNLSSAVIWFEDTFGFKAKSITRH